MTMTRDRAEDALLDWTSVYRIAELTRDEQRELLQHWLDTQWHDWPQEKPERWPILLRCKGIEETAWQYFVCLRALPTWKDDKVYSIQWMYIPEG